MSNIPAFDQLKRAQRLAVISIASGDSPRRTASAAQVTERTIRNWRKLPVFQEALAEARRDFFTSCRSHVTASVITAFRSLVNTAGKPFSDSERLKAALSVLDLVDHSEISAKPSSENGKTLQTSNLHVIPTGIERKPAEMRGTSRYPLETDGTHPERSGT